MLLLDTHQSKSHANECNVTGLDYLIIAKLDGHRYYQISPHRWETEERIEVEDNQFEDEGDTISSIG